MDLKLKDNSQLTLPTGYFPVEYVESSGYPNINTGFSISMYNNSTFKIDAIIEIVDNLEASPIIYNAIGSYRRVSLVCDNSITNFLVYAGTFTSSQSPASVEFSGKVHIIHTQGKIIVNDIQTTVPWASVNASGVLSLLTQSSKVRIWSFKCYTGNTLVRNYIPAVSYQEGHFGEACLYDKVNGVFYYSASTGSFTASSSQSLYDIITSAYVKDCPNISGINLLRSCANLNRVRLDIGAVSGTVAELYKYAAYAGFNDAYENQTKPRLVGTWTISDYWCNNELDTLENTFDGLTIVTDDTLNIDSMLENDELRVQTLDSTKPNYNPAVAIILNAAGWTHTLQEPAIEGGGLFARPKNLATSPTTTFIGKTTVVDTNGIVSDDTTAEYDFENFEEFQYFDNTSIAAGTSTSVLGAFGGCTKLKKIILPNTVTSIGAYAFYNCSALDDITIPSGVTSIGNYAFVACNFTNLYVPTNINGYALSNSGNNNNPGLLYIKGNYTVNDCNNGGSVNAGNYLNYNTIIIEGNVTNGGDTTRRTFTRAAYTHIVRIKGTCAAMYSSYGFMRKNSAQFIEFMSTTSGCLYSTDYQQNCVIHLGYNGLAAALSTFVKANTATHMSNISMIYVGDGTSKAADQAVFDLYNADTDWATYCGSGVPGDGKVDLWWNYNGEYKWYYITDNLTNCTSTNPDEWPHITRGEAYNTTIVPDEGYEITSCSVKMLDTDTTSPTYDTYVDITSSVYDSSTGEINIPSVTGNVVITASAS